MRAVALDLDAVLGDTRPLWHAWLEDAGRRARVDLDLSADRGAAAAVLDERLGNWPALLERFAEDHAPVYLRARPEVNEALRGLRAAGGRLGAYTDAPEPLARVALAHLGAGRLLDAVETGPGALDRLLEILGPDAAVVRSARELQAAAS